MTISSRIIYTVSCDKFESHFFFSCVCVCGCFFFFDFLTFVFVLWGQKLIFSPGDVERVWKRMEETHWKGNGGRAEPQVKEHRIWFTNPWTFFWSEKWRPTNLKPQCKLSISTRTASCRISRLTRRENKRCEVHWRHWFGLFKSEGTKDTICHSLTFGVGFLPSFNFEVLCWPLKHNRHVRVPSLTPKEHNPIEAKTLGFPSLSTYGKWTATAPAEFHEIKIQTCLCFLWEQPWKEPQLPACCYSTRQTTGTAYVLSFSFSVKPVYCLI